MKRFSLLQLLAAPAIAGLLLLSPVGSAQADCEDEDETPPCETTQCKASDFIYDNLLIDTPITNTTKCEFRQMIKNIFD